MLDKRNRIKTREFKRFWRKGKMLTIGKISCSYRFYDWQTKLAVVVSKKNNPSAVSRNKLRRQIYEIFRKYYLDKMENAWLILFYKEGIENFSQEKIFTLLDKICIIQQKNDKTK